MYYIVTESGVYPGKSRVELNKKLKLLTEEPEFTCLGPDKIMRVNEVDIDFLQDKRRMSNIFFGNFFRKDNKVFLLVLVVFILSVIQLVMMIQFMSAISG